MTVTIEISDEEAALCWSNRWQHETIEKVVKDLVRTEAAAYRHCFRMTPEMVAQCVEEWKAYGGLP